MYSTNNNNKKNTHASYEWIVLNATIPLASEHIAAQCILIARKKNSNKIWGIGSGSVHWTAIRFVVESNVSNFNSIYKRNHNCEKTFASIDILNYIYDKLELNVVIGYSMAKYSKSSNNNWCILFSIIKKKKVLWNRENWIVLWWMLLQIVFVFTGPVYHSVEWIMWSRHMTHFPLNNEIFRLLAMQISNCIRSLARDLLKSWTK